MGNYIESCLIRDEYIYHETTFHWVLFVTPRAFFSFFILPMLDYCTSEFAITTSRVIIKVGWIARRTMEMNINKIESINVIQGVWGRILGFGTIDIIGVGGTRESFSKIAKPLKFRRKLQELL